MNQSTKGKRRNVKFHEAGGASSVRAFTLSMQILPLFVRTFRRPRATFYDAIISA